MTENYRVDSFKGTEVTTVIPGKTWVIPNLLTHDECHDLIKKGEEFGLSPPNKEAGVDGKRASQRTETSVPQS